MTGKIAVYALSADPITYGHLDIIERASKHFDKLIIGVGNNPDKKCLFPVEQRIYMIEQSVKHLSNVSVTHFSGLLVDFAFKNGANVVVRGVRNVTDFEYEQSLHNIGLSQKLDIDTHLLITDQSLSHISSGVVKAVQKEHGDIRNFVPPHVKASLEWVISNQILVGITGEPGAGKSTVAQQLVDTASEWASPTFCVHNIELDHLAHNLLVGTNDDPYAVQVRRDIVKAFGYDVINDSTGYSGSISRKKLGDIVFSDRNKLDKLNAIMEKPLLISLRKEIYGKQGIILINAALLTEANMLSMCNNNVIVVECDPVVQRGRLSKRGLTEDQIANRLASQYTVTEKMKIIKEKIRRDGYGTLMTYETTNPFEDLVLNVNTGWNRISVYLQVFKPGS